MPWEAESGAERGGMLDGVTVYATLWTVSLWRELRIGVTHSMTWKAFSLKDSIVVVCSCFAPEFVR